MRCNINGVTESVSNFIIAELAERSPIIIQNSSNPSSRKNLDVRPYDRTTVQGATFNMRGQLEIWIYYWACGLPWIKNVLDQYEE